MLLPVLFPASLKQLFPPGHENAALLNAIEKKKNLQCNKSLDDFSPTDILRGLFDDTTVSLDAFTRKGGQLSDEVRGLLADGKLDAAFEKLPKDDDIIALQSRLTTLNKQSNQGILTFEENNREQAKIIVSLLHYLSNYDKHLIKGGSFRGGERLRGITDSN